MYSKIGGASRWLNLPFIGGQPAELTKLALVLFLAKNLSRPTSDIRSLRPSGVLLHNLARFRRHRRPAARAEGPRHAGAALLVHVRRCCSPPDCPAKSSLLALGGSLGRRSHRHTVIAEPYRIARVMSFLDPWATIKGSGFQIIQSFVAFQNGGLFGAGLRQVQAEALLPPRGHTDFILAVIGEEDGPPRRPAGLPRRFAYLTYIGFKIAALQHVDSYRRFLAFGLTSLIAIEACFNMGVCMGLLPTKGDAPAVRLQQATVRCWFPW